MTDSQTDRRDDAQLVDAINTGDADAFDALYLRYRHWTVNLAWRFTRDRDAALDVMQDTFTYVLRKFPGFELRSKFTTFLYPVVRHTAIAHNRRQRRLNVMQQMPEPHTAPPEPDPREELAAVLSGLSEDHRETILLRFVDGFSMADIAEAMSVPAGTVKSRMHHALKILRDDPQTKSYFDP